MNFPLSFIRAGAEFCTRERHVPAPYFRRCFEIGASVRSAKLLICGLGYYELYLNGTNITKGHLAPYRSNPDDILYYDAYELAPILAPGKNALGILLGNGIQNDFGSYVWDFDKARFRGAPQTAFSLEIEYENGQTQSVSSDEQTLTAPSPILFNDLHYGEYYDARLEIPGWALPDFDDRAWKPAQPAPIPRGETRLCEAEPITVREELAPVSVTERSGVYIYDFGVNTAGLCRLSVKGQAGQKLLLRYFETLVDGEPFVENIRYYTTDRIQEDEYTCRGGETEIYVPHFTYHGFRYVAVSGITPQQAAPSLLTLLVMSSNLRTRGSFSCDYETVNRIQEATVRSDIANFFYFPTDCPQREKNGWTADAALSAEQTLLNLSVENSYREWMRSIYKAMGDQGQLPGIVPTTGWGFNWGNGPAWDSVVAYLPYYTYRMRGDRRIIEEAVIPLMRYLNYLDSCRNENGLIAVGLGDWCQPARDAAAYVAPLAVTDSILSADIAQKCAFIFDVLGKSLQRDFALALAKELRKAVRTHLIDSETLIVSGNCQTSQAMALYYGCFEPEEEEQAFAHLLRLIQEKNGHMDTGVLGGRVLFRLLADCGEAELAFNMIVRPDFPSYGNWIARGATSLWEEFHPEGGRIASLNHHFWGDVSAWFYEYLGGIRLNPTGYDTANVNVQPIFISQLSHVCAEHETPHGILRTEWIRTTGGVCLTVEAAPVLHGKIILPKGCRFENGTAECRLSSGTYRVLCQ